MKTADIIRGRMRSTSPRVNMVARAYGAYIHRRLIMFMFRLTAEERAEQIASAQANPITAGNLEFESWLDELLLERDRHCPDGRPHRFDLESLDPSTGYFWHCPHCGHHWDTPF
jgi:hypothetical protein